jgi:formylglycine-generating enzyme required for sulfatase activity
LRRSSKAGGHWALIFIALLFPFQAIAIQVPAEYQKFIKTAKKPAKPLWQRLCEQFDVCEMSAADISVALVIGVSKYQYLTPLESTQNDAREFADFLLDSGEFEQVILLTEADATKRAIEYFMEDYIPTLLQGRRQRSRFLFYFSGHGERRPGTGRGYLRLANNPKHAYSQSIGMDEVHAWANFNTKNAIHSLFLIDACMSGIVGQQIMGEARFDIRRHPADLIKQSAGILITAGTEDQKTHAGPYWRGSLFNAVLLHGLRGAADRPPSDGVITSQELFAYLESAVSNESHQTQTPQRWELRKFQSGDFFFLAPTRSKRLRSKRQLPAGTEKMGRVAIDVIDREYRTTVNARVRSGPGTEHKTIKTLSRGERVWVTGKVKETNWYQVESDTGVAYIFARLLEPVTARITTGSKPPGISQPPPVSAFGPEMVIVPAGEFEMGSDDGQSDERPVHRVTVKRFAIGKYEATNAEFVAFLNDRGDQLIKSELWFYDKSTDSDSHIIKQGNHYVVESGFENHPAIEVSWDGAQAYVKWLREKTGKKYRLPSEAEWEYAARAGSTTKFPWGDEIGRNKANCRGCGSQWDGKDTAPVGSFAANAFGLFDTVGNVWEWVEDCWHENYEGAPNDGSAWTRGGECNRRVLRGGSWFSFPSGARSAHRGGYYPGNRSGVGGFRIAQDL